MFPPVQNAKVGIQYDKARSQKGVSQITGFILLIY